MRYLGRFAIIFFLSLSLSAFAQDGDDFVFAQLKYDGGDWDPHPKAYEEILYYLISTTNVRTEIKREVVRADDPVLFQRPFLYLAGNGDFNPFSQREINSLRRYLSGGGFLLVDDCSSSLDEAFYKAIKRELKRILPDMEFAPLDQEHAIFYSFYLKPMVRGLTVRKKELEAITLDKDTVVLYSANNLAGVWERDALGNWLSDPFPFGEEQRMEAMKLTLNIIMYALTGSYKKDALHQKAIKEKLRRGLR